MGGRTSCAATAAIALLGFGSAGCARDAAEGPVVRADALVDGADADATGEVDAGDASVPDVEDAPDAAADVPDVPLGPTFVFPATGDKKTVKVEPAFWNAGDAVSGTRTLLAASVSKLTGAWELTANDLSDKCGLLGTTKASLPVAVSVNGTKVGTVVLEKASGLSVPLAFTFPAIAGPVYTVRYEVTTTVATGCGNVQTTWDVSKLTLE